MRVGILLFVFAVPISVSADAMGYAASELAPVLHPRTARLDVGLVSFQVAGFAGTAFWLFTEAVRESRYDCPPDSGFCLDFDWGPMFGGTGALSLILAGVSSVLLVRTVRELRWRKAGTAELAKSLSFNRFMIANDALMSIGYAGVTIPFAVFANPEERGWTAIAVVGSVMLGLHVWSLALNGRELRRGKRHRSTARADSRRIQALGSGFRW